MAQVPRVTAVKRQYSALVRTIYARHVADGYVTASEREEMTRLLTYNAQGDALIDELVAAMVNQIRSPFGERLTDRQMRLAAWEPALAEIEDVLKTAGRSRHPLT